VSGDIERERALRLEEELRRLLALVMSRRRTPAEIASSPSLR
jgi:hypothetical protein